MIKKRSIESAKLLNPEVKTIPDPLFRETELPTRSMELFDLKLRPSIWSVTLRLLWFSGYSNECESLSNAKIRAKKASQQLIDYTDEYKSVVLIDHRFINMFISLQKKGWKGKRKAGTKHWNCTTYSFLN